jgi:peptidoglycan L-alanyl-D-glutamate endopeptidase CwlK
MIDSRDLKELHPAVREKAEAFLAACQTAGIIVLIYSTYRDFESQNALYAIGRTEPGQKITNAKGGQSYHNWRVAFDFVPIRDGVAVWNTSGANGKLWKRLGEIGESVGLEWGGRWKRLSDYPHLQYTGGLRLADFQAGKTL